MKEQRRSRICIASFVMGLILGIVGLAGESQRRSHAILGTLWSALVIAAAAIYWVSLL